MIFELPVTISEDTTIVETYKVVLEDDNTAAKLFKIEKRVVEEIEEIIETYSTTFYKHPFKFDDNGQRYKWTGTQEVVDWMLGKGYSEKESE
jgi:hypothetical protein